MSERESGKSDSLITDIVRVLIHTHNLATINTAESQQAAAGVQALADLLIERDVLDRKEFEDRRQEVTEALERQQCSRGIAVALQDFGVSKYAYAHTAVVDCESRMPLCHSVCCRMQFALTKEDVHERIVQWDVERPYIILQSGNGYCAHRNTGNGLCTIHDQRPIPCRGYDCRHDQRIWLDFEAKIVNPKIHSPDWPRCFDPDPQSE